jgi:uncharacterized protein (DUF427 family)
VEHGLKRVRAYLGGEVVADTAHPRLVWEVPYYPAYYFPVEDVRNELLAPTSTVTHSPSRGDAQHFTIKAGGKEVEDAALQYVDSPIEELRHLIRLDWDSMDGWFEEDEEVYTHPRDPYTRVDILATSRHVRVELDGVVLTDSTNARVLFETGLPPRWYIPKVDLRMDLLVPTDTATHCPYKGQAILGGAGGRPPGRRPRLVVPHAVAGEPEDRGAGCLLQRAGRPVHRRQAPGPARHEVQQAMNGDLEAP